MAENTKIEWTTHTFNPWRGCTKVSPGCANCYAETLSGRNPKTLGIWGQQGTRVVAAESYWREPLKWNKAAACCCRKTIGDHEHETGCPQRNRPRVFCASLSDVFENWTGPMVNSASDELFIDRQGGWSDRSGDKDGHRLKLTMGDVRARLFRLIHETSNLDWLLLTKRPENVSRHLDRYAERIDTYAAEAFSKVWMRRVWLGTSVENQDAANDRIPHLLRTPAAVRFLSCEPLLGPVDLTNPFYGLFAERRMSLDTYDMPGGEPDDYEPLPAPRIDWVIVGGESGHSARPCNLEWIRDIVRQCKSAGVPCFVKQLGSNVTANYYDEFREEFESQRGYEWPDAIDWNHRNGQPPITARVALPLAKKGGNPDEWPADLRVREFPTHHGA